MMGPLEIGIFHYLVWPLVLLGLCRWWFGPLARLSFAWVFLVGWLLLIHAQALEVFWSGYEYPEFLLSVWATPFIVLLVSGPILRGLGHRIPTLQDLPRGTPPGPRDALVLRAAPFLTAGLWVLIAIYIFDIGVKNVAFFFILANPGSAVDAMLLRLSGLTSNISPVLTTVYGYTRALFLPMYAAIATALVVSGRMGRLHWVFVMLGTAFFSLLAAAKSPLAFTLAGAALAAYMARPGRIGLGRLGFGFVLVLFIPALIYPLLSGSTGTEALVDAGENLWRRVTYVTSETGGVYFDAFPNLYDHQGASSNRILATLANVDGRPTPSLIYDRYLNDSGILHGGRVNTAFYASFFADWGGAGVVLGAIAVGLLVLGLQLFFDRRRGADAIVIGMRAATLIALTQLMISDLYGTLLGRGLLSIPILLWTFDLVLGLRPRGPAAAPIAASRHLQGR
jgi:hypothetical protein